MYETLATVIFGSFMVIAVLGLIAWVVWYNCYEPINTNNYNNRSAIGEIVGVATVVSIA